MRLIVFLLFKVGLLAFGTCDAYRGPFNYGRLNNEIADRSQFRSLVEYGKINKCCDFGEIFDLTEFGSSLTCRDGNKRHKTGVNLPSYRMFQHSIPQCLNLYQDFIKNFDDLMGNSEGRLFYKDTVYHDYCVEFDLTTDKWLILACQFVPKGVVASVTSNNQRHMNKCCPNGQIYVKNEFDQLVCSKNHPSERTFRSNKEVFKLDYGSPLSCTNNVVIKTVQNVNEIGLTTQQQLIYHKKNYTNYCIDFLTSKLNWIVLTCPGPNTDNFKPVAAEATPMPFASRTVAVHVTTSKPGKLRMTVNSHPVQTNLANNTQTKATRTAITRTSQHPTQKPIMHGVPKCCPRNKNLDEYFICTDADTSRLTIETFEKVLTLQYRYLHCPNQKNHIFVEDIDKIRPTTDRILTYKKRRFPEYCIDFLPSEDTWVIEHCMETQPATFVQNDIAFSTEPSVYDPLPAMKINKCCAMNQDYLIENGKIFCVNGGKLNSKISIKQRSFSLVHNNPQCGRQVKRFYLQQPNLLDVDTSRDQLLYKNTVYNDYCIEYEQKERKIMLVSCPKQRNRPRILNTNDNNQASTPPLTRTFPKCCPFHHGIALDTETQLVGCYPHTLLDTILQQKYRQFEFVQNTNCQLDMRNAREINDNDLESTIDNDSRIQAGNGYCIDEEVKFGDTHLFYC